MAGTRRDRCEKGQVLVLPAPCQTQLGSIPIWQCLVMSKYINFINIEKLLILFVHPQE